MNAIKRILANIDGNRDTRTVMKIEMVRLIWVRGRTKGMMRKISKFWERLGAEKMRIENKIKNESEIRRVLMSFWKTALRSSRLS